MPLSITPGPWRVNPTDDGNDIDIDGDGFRVCSLSIQAALDCEPPYDVEEVKANARAIAALPDTLTALQGAYDCLRTLAERDEEAEAVKRGDSAALYRQFYRKASEAALRKAGAL